jgi:signal transduction histidine kinase
LNEALAEERAAIQTKLRNLAESHEQIRQIISLQQGYAGLSGVKELAAVPELVSDVTTLFVDSLRHHEINIVCDYAPALPEISIEKHKALQILVNLLQNARDATKVVESARRAITIRAREVSDHKVLIEVSDNGMGIKPENLNRIFNFGFTTKNDGHGFGLHGCANLAREMGGALSVQSDGEGKGATFALLLPINAPVEKA